MLDSISKKKPGGWVGISLQRRNAVPNDVSSVMTYDSLLSISEINLPENIRKKVDKKKLKNYLEAKKNLKRDVNLKLKRESKTSRIRPPWWMWLTKNANEEFETDSSKRLQIRRTSERGEEEEEVEEAEEEECISEGKSTGRSLTVKVGSSEDICSVGEMITELKSKLRRKEERKEERLLNKISLCRDFWETLRRDKQNLANMMSSLDFLKIMLRKELKISAEPTPIATWPIISISITYLDLKTQECETILKRYFDGLVGFTDDELAVIRCKYNMLADEFLTENLGFAISFSKLMRLYHKISRVKINHGIIKEEILYYYIDGIGNMMRVLKIVIKQIKLLVRCNPTTFKKAYGIIQKTKKFIWDQIPMFKYLREKLMNIEWTYIYYTRIRVVKALQTIIETISNELSQDPRDTERKIDQADYVNKYKLFNKNKGTDGVKPSNRVPVMEDYYPYSSSD